MIFANSLQMYILENRDDFYWHGASAFSDFKSRGAFNNRKKMKVMENHLTSITIKIQFKLNSSSTRSEDASQSVRTTASDSPTFQFTEGFAE